MPRCPGEIPTGFELSAGGRGGQTELLTPAPRRPLVALNIKKLIYLICLFGAGAPLINHMLLYRSGKLAVAFRTESVGPFEQTPDLWERRSRRVGGSDPADVE
jgi:hypothetical protein